MGVSCKTEAEVINDLLDEDQKAVQSKPGLFLFWN